MFDINNIKFVACCCIGSLGTAIVWQALYPSSDVDYLDEQYDFIVVGAGTAGCVMASRLSSDPKMKVLLVEAGGDMSLLSEVPMLPTLLQRGGSDWAFYTQPQKHSSTGFNHQMQFLPRGKGLGGSGRLNYLLHSTGTPEDFDTWEMMGAKGWGYKHLKPYFNKIFKLHYNSTRHQASNNNIIRLSSTEEKLQAITQTFLDSAADLPPSSPLQMTAIKSTVHKGRRESSYKSYLLGALGRSNLHVMKNALVTKINFIGKVADSIEVLKNKMIHRTHIKAEVILCAGALQTPQILTLSGVGPRSELDRLDIRPVHVLEGVGRNLHDHLNVPLYVSIDKPMSITVKKVISLETLYSYLVKGKGYLSSSGVVALARGQNHTGIMLFAVGAVDEVFFCHVVNMKNEIFKRSFPLYSNSSQEGFIFMNSCLQPHSRGRVYLNSKDPTQVPIVDPEYLADQRDVDCHVKALKMAVEVIKTPTFQRLGATIHWPHLPQCRHLWKAEEGGKEAPSPPYLECLVRSNAMTGHHPGGTCSMAGENAVLYPNLLVRGIKKVSVMDASVFPTPVSSPPNSVIIAMADRAAQGILDRHATR